ncbi:MAG: SpoIIE family protein phosphatase [Armatimonadetes bacterium]|nr:SpoIIE family protein phosphatase [Armatimonadota bacterium]
MTKQVPHNNKELRKPPRRSPDKEAICTSPVSDAADMRELIDRTEEALKTAKEHAQALQQLIDNMPAGVLLMDSELRLLAWNKLYVRYFDPSVKWQVGTRIEDIIPLAEESGILSKLRRALRTQRPVSVRDFRYDGLARGTTYWHAAAVPLRLKLEGGPTAALALVVVDVTPEVIAREKFSQMAFLAEKRAAELEAERARLETIIECAPIALVVCDTDLNVIASNSVTRQYAKLLGLNEQPLGRLDFRFPGLEFSDRDGNPLDSEGFVIARSLQGETCRDHVMTCRSRNGSTITVKVNTAPLTNSEGRITGVVIAALDITDEKKAQEEIREIYLREHAIAEKLQTSFLQDECPEIPGFEITQRYQAALDEAAVGGDFYDLFRLTDEKLGVVIADVAGKGLNAAVYTAMTKYMLRAYAFEESNPELVLARLNEALTACTPAEIFVTVVYGILDQTKSTFSFANAGHELPIHYSHRLRKATSLDVTGRALALVQGSSYTTQTITLEAGDLLVLYTDGITDAGHGITRLGKERLLWIIESYGSAQGEVLVDNIMNAAMDYAGGRLMDDAALLVVRARSS